MQTNYTYASALAASQRINWRVEDIIGGDVGTPSQRKQDREDAGGDRRDDDDAKSGACERTDGLLSDRADQSRRGHRQHPRTDHPAHDRPVHDLAGACHAGADDAA